MIRSGIIIVYDWVILVVPITDTKIFLCIDGKPLPPYYTFYT